MLKCTLAAIILCLASAATCCAANLDALLFPLTGEVQLRNNSGAAVPFVYSSIASSGNTLNPGSWASISDYYDVSGNGFIDPSFNWTKIATASNQLTEGAFTGPGGSLAAFRSVSLGPIWNASLYPINDLAFTVLQADTTPITITKHYALAGDYNNNGLVDTTDWLVWKAAYGSTTSLAADGNLNGVVDAADFTIWRNNYGQFIPFLGSGSDSGAGAGGPSLQPGGNVPEPALASLLAIAGMAALTARGRVRRVERRAAHRS